MVVFLALVFYRYDLRFLRFQVLLYARECRPLSGGRTTPACNTSRRPLGGVGGRPPRQAVSFLSAFDPVWAVHFLNTVFS